MHCFFFFFKQNTAYELRISDWRSDVCSSDLTEQHVDGLLDALKYEAPVRPKLVHRLDKDTSGALLIARTPRAAAYFAKSFSNRSAKKTYWALIVGVPDIQQGEIDLPLAKQPGSGGEKMHVHDSGLASKTRYRVIERAGNSAEIGRAACRESGCQSV